MNRLFLIFSLLFSMAMADTLETFIASARSQVGRTLTYDPAYVRLKYPGGDIPISRGVCTDVVVRALRGVKIDMQQRIHEHKKQHPALYKGLYGTNRLDANIDHRRVKNLQAYFAARKYRVRGAFQPGDIVVWKLPGSHLDHIGICSDKKNAQGEPLIIHNVGAGAQEEDVLHAYSIVDHFRLFHASR